MAWAPLIGTTDTPSALRSRPDRRAASVNASSSVTPSTKTIMLAPFDLPVELAGWLTAPAQVDEDQEAADQECRNVNRHDHPVDAKAVGENAVAHRLDDRVHRVYEANREKEPHQRDRATCVKP